MILLNDFTDFTFTIFILLILPNDFTDVRF